MPNFVQKKLQVFVSSTFSDLKPERQAAVEAILTAGHIPAGMELFTAGDESQMDVIKQWIDESDVFLLILGARYGSIEPNSGKSYVQLEYEYAQGKGKPLFSCAIAESAIEPRVKAKGLNFVERDNPNKLRDFRAAVLSRVTKFWEDSKDIKIAIAEKLSELAREDATSGWVRASSQSNTPALADEIARLSKENAELRRISDKGHDAVFAGLTFSELKNVLESDGLLGPLLHHRHELAEGMSTRLSEVARLASRGLLEAIDVGNGVRHYRFSPAGKAFLNKWDALQLGLKPSEGFS